MAKPIEVYGTLKRVDGPLKLVPDAEKHPDLQDTYISCPKHIGSEKAREGWTATFLVEETEDAPGTASHRVVGIVAERAANRPERVSQRSPSAPIGDGTHDRFIHPYNFVRLPSAGALAEAIKHDGLFQRSPSAPHDVYKSNLNTGYIDCELTTHTHWFIPDPRKIHKPGDHATLGYFTLDDVPKDSWNHATAHADKTVPAVPGSSLRGMIRSVFEAVTLSCFSVFDSDRLDFRIGYSPDHEGTRGTDASRGAARYVPCRVVESPADGSLRIQWLDGKIASDSKGRPIALPVVLVNAYSPCVLYESPPKSGKHVAGRQLPDAAHADRTPVIAICNRALSTKTKTIKKTGKTITPFRYREITKPLMAVESSDTLDVSSVNYNPATETVVFGYLHRTGPNIENKHDERVFFRGDATYNALLTQQLTSEQLHNRATEFLADQQGSAFVKPHVVRNTITMLKAYTNRNAKHILGLPPRNLASTGSPPFPSDFVARHERDVAIQNGDLFYALIEEVPDEFGKLRQTQTVHGLYPVAIPRLSHEESRGDLLHDGFYPCSRRHEKCPRCSNLDLLPEEQRDLCEACKNDWTCLCPACRVFGWTRDLSFFRREDRERLKGNADRIDAVAGHVRFSHGTLVGSWDESRCKQVEAISLCILGSPHPTATGFYLHPHQNWEAQRGTRWPPVTALQNDRNPVANLPAYRHEEAQLRGRKFYRRREQTTRAALENPNQPKQSDQNQTVHALPSNLTFKFRIHFDNLSDAELGALLFALELAVPDDWMQALEALPENAQFHHALGHGKPLGMGRCSIKVTGIARDRADRYSAAQFTTTTSTSTARPVTDSDRQAFFESWQLLEGCNDLIQMRSDLLEMLVPIPSRELIEYPLVKVVNGSANFSWWKEAKTSGASLPLPNDERNDAQDRFPKDEMRLQEFADRQRNKKV
jgi:CRISPR-associated protein (TIGR03986 family)